MRRGFELFLRARAELSSGVGRWVEGARSKIRVSFVELVRRSYVHVFRSIMRVSVPSLIAYRLVDAVAVHSLLYVIV
jgi:hypothetical protein